MAQKPNATIMMGIPGSGKNYFIENEMPRDIAVVSTDDFHYVCECGERKMNLNSSHPLYPQFSRNRVCTANGPDKEGHLFEYKFDFKNLPIAHGLCFWNFIDCLRVGMDVVVNNTNTTEAEIAAYLAAAQGTIILPNCYEVHIVAMICPVEVAIKRNVHGVPAHTIENMDERLQKTLANWKPWWPPVQRVEND